MFERISVPLDESSRAEDALPVAARIARASGGSLHEYHEADDVDRAATEKRMKGVSRCLVHSVSAKLPALLSLSM